LVRLRQVNKISRLGGRQLAHKVPLCSAKIHLSFYRFDGLARPSCSEADLKASQFFSAIFKIERRILSMKSFFAVFAFLSVAALSVVAQHTVPSPYQGEADGVSVGGKWVEFRSEDKMTGAKKVRFELQADNYLSLSPDYKPRIEMVCTNRKYTYADFNPGMRLGPPNRPGFWGQPQIEVMVRVDDTHHYHGWNWIRGRFLSMDKGTTRELMAARIFKIQIPGPRGPEIAEFSPAGLDLARVREDCDLKPKKPSKD
jgi:hypothetical protein